MTIRHKLRLWWRGHWLWVCIALLAAVSVILPAVYLAGLEENTRRYLVAMNVASLPWGLANTLVFVGFLYLLQFGGGFARFRKVRINSEAVRVRFTDVVGLGQAKREAWEVVQLLRDRRRLNSIGGHILRGVLMSGPPGCGKTLLAKAIAAEAGVPFLSVSGAEFVEVFVGVGAARVRKLFRQARDYAAAYGACIIFIDEIEVIGRTRILHDAFGGGAETNSTQNQLLLELDGLSGGGDNIVVIGATNAREDILDPALLRPGRFDRKIFVGRPNLAERELLFGYYLGKIKRDPQLDVARLARKAVGKTPAEIENVVREAALIAARGKKDFATMRDMTSAIERIELGVEHRLSLTPREREMTAWHEAGHVLALYLTHPANDVFKVSIRQRGGALGVVHSMPREEIHSADRDTLLAHIRVSLGGYAAEQLRYGVTTEGVGLDFAAAMELAHKMVWRLGMGDSALAGDYPVIPETQLSESVKQKLNEDTQRIISGQLAQVQKLLREERPAAEALVRELLAREELDFDEIADVMLKCGKPPRVMQPAAEPASSESGARIPAGN
ncbi:MAG: AAA family ATPase [Elusimicrobiales bacterium]|nr:AAA family ATPase [Elusimicrobiales bacterium]